MFGLPSYNDITPIVLGLGLSWDWSVGDWDLIHSIAFRPYKAPSWEDLEQFWFWFYYICRA